MNKPLVLRNNRMFVLDETQLPESAKNTPTKNALYADIYMEFRGASKNPKYKDLTIQQRMKVLNTFALNWLQVRGYK